MPRKDLVVLLEWIAREVPSAPGLVARLRGRRRDPVLKILMQTILSHQTTSSQTRLAIEQLWARFNTLERLMGARPAEIELLIRNVGLARVKARYLIAMAIDIDDRWRTEQRFAHYLRSAPLEDARRALLELPGVGPKTAAVVLLFRFGRPTFPVDTNILRVARELGWVSRRAGAEEVRHFVERRLPKDPEHLLKAHAYLIMLGRITQRGRRGDMIRELRQLSARRPRYSLLAR